MSSDPGIEPANMKRRVMWLPATAPAPMMNSEEKVVKEVNLSAIELSYAGNESVQGAEAGYEVYVTGV